MRNLLFILPLLVLSACVQQSSPYNTDFEAPPFDLVSLNGDQLSLDRLEGSVVVIHFGTSWCPFCRAEDPHLEALHQEYQDQGVQVLVINVGESDKKAVEWKEEAGFSFPMLMDRDGAISASYAPADAQPDLPRHEVMIASNLVIDRAGNVRFMSLLDTNNFDAKLVALRSLLDQVLAEDADGIPSAASRVQVRTPDRITMQQGEQAEGVISMDIKKGYHVQANPVHYPYLIPTELELESTELFSQITTRYPAGKPYALMGSPDTLHVYDGTLDLNYTLAASDAVTVGDYVLSGIVTYQTCDDRSCFPPVKATVTVRVQVL